VTREGVPELSSQKIGKMLRYRRGPNARLISWEAHSGGRSTVRAPAQPRGDEMGVVGSCPKLQICRLAFVLASRAKLALAGLSRVLIRLEQLLFGG
jgi:hypothetical protein